MEAYWLYDYMVSALGFGTEKNVEAIRSGRSGIRVIDNPELCKDRILAGAIDWGCIKDMDGMHKLETLIMHCLQKTKADNSSTDFSSPRFRIVLSSTKGNIDLLAESGLQDNAVFLSDMAKRVADKIGITTEPIVISNACISGLSAIMVAKRLICSGKCDNVVVVGADILSEFVISGFRAFKSVSDKICRPYDKARDGLSMGEACGVVLLGNHILDKMPAAAVCVKGAAVSNDANHISGPSRTGDGLYYAIRAALGEAELQARDIDFISAHGTATVYNDEMESKAFNLAGLAGCPLNSLKPYFGHTLGACGVIESILAVWQLRHAHIFGTLGYENCGVPFELSVSDKERQLDRSRNCLKTASGFAGCNAAIVFSIYDKENNDCSDNNLDNAHTEIKCIAESELTIPENRNYDEYILEQFRELNSPNIKFYKMDRLCKAAYIAAEKLLRGIKLPDDRTKVAVVLYNRSASLDTDLKHQTTLNHNEPASPAVFVYTLPNIMCGEICIRHKINGENTFFVQDGKDGFPLEYARLLLERNIAEYVIYGENDVLDDFHTTRLQLLVINK